MYIVTDFDIRYGAIFIEMLFPFYLVFSVISSDWRLLHITFICFYLNFWEPSSNFAIEKRFYRIHTSCQVRCGSVVSKKRIQFLFPLFVLDFCCLKRFLEHLHHSLCPFNNNNNNNNNDRKSSRHSKTIKNTNRENHYNEVKHKTNTYMQDNLGTTPQLQKKK